MSGIDLSERRAPRAGRPRGRRAGRQRGEEEEQQPAQRVTERRAAAPPPELSEERHVGAPRLHCRARISTPASLS